MMTPGLQQDQSALRWVRAELDQTLVLARRALEDFAEGETTTLGDCVEYLHNVRGTLEIVKVYGGSMLADELVKLASELNDNNVARPDAAAEVLMLGMVQLPSYLERVESGEPDIPLILLPLMNDVRAARGAPLVSEISLFAPNLEAVVAAEAIVPGSGNPELARVIAETRADYHRGLLGWFRSPDPKPGLQQLISVIEKLNGTAGTNRLRRLLDSTEALLVSLADGSIETSSAIKVLFGELDRFLKVVADQGEEQAVADFPIGLLKNQLYYVAQSNSSNPIVQSVHKSADLANSYLEVDSEASGSLAGPGKELFAAVSDALRQDLLDIQDQLDLFIRGDRTEYERLQGLADPIQRVGDTLGMVGRGELRARLKPHCERLREIESVDQILDDDDLMELASDILAIESALSGLDQAAPVEEIEAQQVVESDSAVAQSGLSNSEYQEHVKAALAEAMVEFTKAKEAITQHLQGGESSAQFVEVPARLHNVAGMLKILKQDQSSRLLDQLGIYLRELTTKTEVLEDEDCDAVADVVVGIEYYMDAVSQNASQSKQLLDYANEALRRLGHGIEFGQSSLLADEASEDIVVDESDLTDTDRLPTQDLETVDEPSSDINMGVESDLMIESDLMPEVDEPPKNKEEASTNEESDTDFFDLDTADLTPASGLSDSTAYIETDSTDDLSSEFLGLNQETSFTELDSNVQLEGELAAEKGQAEEETVKANASEPPQLLEDIDSEILEVFQEEADEELEAIQREYPQWRDEKNAESLQTIRRSFHTLKGSGRLVGALTIGEFAWSIEDLLNRVIDNSIVADAPVFGLMDEVVAILPSLVSNQLSRGQLQQVDSIKERANALANNKPLPTVEPDTLSLDTEDQDSELSEEVESSLVNEDTDFSINLDTEYLTSDATEMLTIDVDSTELTDSQYEEVSADMELGLTEILEDSSELETLKTTNPALSVVGSADEANATATTEVESQLPVAIELDSALHEIFRNEASSHIEALADFVKRCEAESTGLPFDDDIKRTVHTIRGSSNAAGVAPMAAIGSALEAWIETLQQNEVQSDPATNDLVSRSHLMLASLLDIINQPGATLPEWQPLIDEINQRAADIEPPDSQIAEDDDDGMAQFDSELIEIFMEEANELGDGLEYDYDQWLRAPSDAQVVTRLQRALHTIKGGARLAGISQLSNLSHAMESLFDSIIESRVEVDTKLQNLVRFALDAQAGDLEMMQVGRDLDEHDELIQKLEAAAHGDPWEAVDSDDSQPTHDLVMGEQPTDELKADQPSSLLDDGFADSEDYIELTDSQLMTDSQFLSEDDSVTLMDEPASESDDSRVIPFPSSSKDDAKDDDKQNTAAIRRPVPYEDAGQSAQQLERVRVRSDLLDQMVNNSGEVSIYRARLDQQNNTLGYDLQELGQTIDRLTNQLRGLEIETEAQILSRYEREGDKKQEGFDPLEMDQYSTMQQLSRALSETVNDLSSIGDGLGDLNRDIDTLLVQQERVITDLHDGLLRTRMVPLSSRVPRLQRLVRQTSHALGKDAALHVLGADGEMDRAILDRMMGPLEHLLRNAVAHGIETREQRAQTDKPAQGRINLELSREGADVVLSVSDDGRGLDREAIRAKAISKGLLNSTTKILDTDLDQFVLQPGFTTESKVSQISGRGVGLDVVLSEIKQIGGSLDIKSTPDDGTAFIVRLPFTLAITEALLVANGEDLFAIPYSSIDGVVRVSHADLAACYEGETDNFTYNNRDYLVRYLGSMMGVSQPHLQEGRKWYPVLLVSSGEHRVAVHVDELLGNRQVVAKSVGTQLSSVRWFTGGTILADGRIALILDINSLVRVDGIQHLLVESEDAKAEDQSPVTVMVVDDSITVRKVTSRLLERHNMQVITAKDGVDAVTVLQEQQPDVMLLDIEMPRMDGFELARHMRSSSNLNDIPIIMITSRTGEKHRKHAAELGVERYLGKPYQEADLLDNIYTALAEANE